MYKNERFSEFVEPIDVDLNVKGQPLCSPDLLTQFSPAEMGSPVHSKTEPSLLRRRQQGWQGAEQLVRQQERTRILRDMHDGVGAHISTAIRQLQSGHASHDEVLHTLRDSLDQLKLSIDAMSQPPGDINALLANLRYRLEPRFQACDLHWQWQVALLEPIARDDTRAMTGPTEPGVLNRRVYPRLMDASAMRQLQFMLLEALSNVLQHAQASILCVAAHAVGPYGRGVQIQIIDNGLGFDVSRPRGNGLRSMQERALAIGVALRLHSAPGRTVVEITME